MKQKFYVCKHCGNVITKLSDSSVNVVCCSEEMSEMIPGTVDASKEKHIPVYANIGNTIFVAVGSVLHPMQDNHYIEWIFIETKLGSVWHHLKPGDSPKVRFTLSEDDEVISVYAYCNLHGLWQA